MDTFSITEVKAHFSKLVEKAAKGQSFIIAKDGKPMVKVMALDPSEQAGMKRVEDVWAE